MDTDKIRIPFRINKNLYKLFISSKTGKIVRAPGFFIEELLCDFIEDYRTYPQDMKYTLITNPCTHKKNYMAFCTVSQKAYVEFSNISQELGLSKSEIIRRLIYIKLFI